jgi:hypothetical protein
MEGNRLEVLESCVWRMEVELSVGDAGSATQLHEVSARQIECRGRTGMCNSVI